MAIYYSTIRHYLAGSGTAKQSVICLDWGLGPDSDYFVLYRHCPIGCSVTRYGLGMMAIIKEWCMKGKQALWFVGLWLAGFLTLALIAGAFRFLVHLAY